MKQIFKIFVITLFFISFQTSFCGNRNLIMLLDWNSETVATDLSPQLGSSKGFGPVTSMLVTALWQQAAPIIVTSSIWKNFIERKEIFGDFVSKNTTELFQKYRSKYTQFSQMSSIEKFVQFCKDIFAEQLSQEDFRLILGFLLCYTTPVDSKEWHIQKITDYIYLLIPQKYLNQIKTYGDTPINPGTFGLSDENLLLGLKTGTLLANPFVLTTHQTTPQLNFSEEFLKTLPKIFVTTTDLKVPDKEKTEENISRFLHDWLIFLNGHGSPEMKGGISYIAALSYFDPTPTKKPDFPKFLAFLNNKIKTDFLFYETCYAGGPHLVKPYEKAWFYPPLEKGRGERRALTADVFNYTIAAETLAHVVTIGYWPSISMPYSHGQRPRFAQNFSEFFRLLGEYVYPKVGKKPSQLSQVLQTVHRFIDDSGNLIEVMQIPAVRFPGTEWFSVLDTPNKIEELTRVLIETHEAEGKDIVIKNKQVVLLDVESPRGRRKEAEQAQHSAVLTPIKIEQATPLVFISRVPDEAVYYFEKLEAKQWGLHDLLVNFLFVNELGYGRSYYIKTLLAKNDLLPDQAKLIGFVPNEGITLNNVLILNNARNPYIQHILKTNVRNHGIFFSFNGKHFSAFWEPTDQQALVFNQSKTLPNLKQETIAPTAIPKYPFAIEKDRLKEVFEIQQKRKEMQTMMAMWQKLKTDPAALARWKQTLSKKQRELIESIEKVEKIKPEAKTSQEVLMQALSELQKSLQALSRRLQSV